MDSPLAHPLDLLVQRYREAILTKRLMPGTKLLVSDEARAIGVSLRLMRSAFRSLATMGLVTLEAGGQVVIGEKTIQSIQSLGFGSTRRRA